MVRRVFGRARCVIANSRSTRHILLDEWQLPEEQVRLLHPGVDTKRFTPAPRDPAFRREVAWDERPVVLTVGRLQRRKGHDQMIRALVTVRKRIPDVLYAVVGEGEERPRLERLIAENGLQDHIRLMGEADDRRLIRCYQQCDLFALPNRREGADIEGFGMVLVEAQACGKPVVAGDSGGTAETMKLPETGRVVNCDGPELLAGVVSELLSQPELLSRMGEEGRRWVVEQFDWDTLAGQARTLFEGI
jgi:phosphatidylinositol alpha-1,6-mannosyltransferase